MNLVESLLAAITRADGDALVLHVGERPYVVAPSGQVELSDRVLNAQSVSRILSDILPEDQRRALAELGAVEHQLSPLAGHEDQFKVVVARGGDDIWIEIRRDRQPMREPLVFDRPVSVPSLEAPQHGDIDDFEPIPSPLGTGQSDDSREDSTTEVPPAVILPLQRGPVRPQAAMGAPGGSGGTSSLNRLLKVAAARGASTLYVAAQAPPLVRVDGDISVLSGERPLDVSDVETLLLDLAPEPSREALRSGIVTEWISDVADVGRVRCMSFTDHRGPGGIFRLMPAHPLSADHLGLSAQMRALAGVPDGLVMVTGPRASGKSTLVSAFVDLINRSRSEHLITFEEQITFVHESRRAFVSQREVRGGQEEMADAVRTALREDPDVVVLEDMGSARLVNAALDAAVSGRLVIGAVAAPDASTAVERLIDVFPAERRPHLRQVLAGALRGVVAQVLLRKTAGGRLAARELLLNTAPVANLIAEGKTFQLPLAIESGRKHGMVPLNDALAAFVQNGAVDAREAYRWASDREGLVTLLKRAGIDTSFVGRLA